MKQAIITKYLAPTMRHGARVKAWCSSGKLIKPWNHSLDNEENHVKIAQELFVRLKWGTLRNAISQLRCGAMPKEGYVFTHD